MKKLQRAGTIASLTYSVGFFALAGGAYLYDKGFKAASKQKQKRIDALETALRNVVGSHLDKLDDALDKVDAVKPRTGPKLIVYKGNQQVDVN